MLISVCLLCLVALAEPTSVIMFESEDIPVGHALDESSILDTMVLPLDSGHVTMCSLQCKTSRPCLGFLIKDGECKTLFKFNLVADPSVSRKLYFTILTLYLNNQGYHNSGSS